MFTMVVAGGEKGTWTTPHLPVSRYRDGFNSEIAGRNTVPSPREDDLGQYQRGYPTLGDGQAQEE